jgi:hypothetical protein
MEDNKDTEVEKTEVAEPEKEEVTKTYTKEDLDNSFNAGVKKAHTDWQKDEKYKEFLAWKKSNQNDVEKLAELEKSNTAKDAEISSLKSLLKVKDSDVKKEFQKFVSTEVMNMVNEETDFDTALKKYKAENPQYFGEVVVKKVQSSPNLSSGGSKAVSTNDIMNSILRGNKN